jgi:tRNA-dihydrouridine synthase
MKIYSAPLQGFTEAVWRNIHSEVFGGMDGYYTPFLRYEHGEIRNKDIRDIERKNNAAHNLVPQVIAATPDEMRVMAEQAPDVAKFLEGKTIVKVVAVPKRMVNFVVK